MEAVKDKGKHHFIQTSIDLFSFFTFQLHTLVIIAPIYLPETRRVMTRFTQKLYYSKTKEEFWDLWKIRAGLIEEWAPRFYKYFTKVYINMHTPDTWAFYAVPTEHGTDGMTCFIKFYIV